MYTILSRMIFFNWFSLAFFLVSATFLFCSRILADEDRYNHTLQEKRPEVHLSLALRYQARAKGLLYSGQQKEAFELYSASAQEFENYFLKSKLESYPPEVYLNAALVNYEVSNTEKAESYLKKVLELDPKFRDAIVFQIRILIRQGKFSEAESILEKQVASSPEDSDFLYLLGSINKEMGNSNKAILYFTSLHDSIKNRNGNPRYRIPALKNLGDLYYQKGDPKKALFYYQAYLVLSPKDYQVRFQVAQIFHFLGDFGAAKKILESIQRENPKEKGIELLLAEMYFIESKAVAYSYILNLYNQGKIPKNHFVYSLYQILAGDFRDGCKFLEGFIQKNENRIAARLGWLDCIRLQKPETELILELNRFLELATQHRQFFLVIRMGRELKNLQQKNQVPPEEIAKTDWILSEAYEQLDSPNQAILHAKKAIRNATNSPYREYYEVNLGHILLGEKIRRFDEAIRIADEVLQKNPSNPNAHYLKANAYFLKKNYSTSLESINQAIHIDPKNPNYYFFRGMLLEKLGQYENMERDMLQSIELNPKNPVAYNYLGYVYADKGINLDKAYELILKAIEIEPDNGAYQDSLGWIYFRKGDLENAVFHLQLAKQMLEDRGIKDFTVYEHLGDVYWAKKDSILARDYWKKSLSLVENTADKERIQTKINK